MYLTRRQLELVDFIRSFRQAERVSPTLEEIARHFGVSKITVFEHVEALKKKGVLQKVKNHARSIQLVGDEKGVGSLSIPMEGAFPDERDGGPGRRPEGVSLAPLAAADGACFALRVRGDSLADGDLLIVHRRSAIRPGEVAILRTETGEREMRRIPALTELPTGDSKPQVEGVLVAVVRMF